jgi:ankyrin repeat protein
MVHKFDEVQFFNEDQGIAKSLVKHDSVICICSPKDFEDKRIELVDNSYISLVWGVKKEFGIEHRDIWTRVCDKTADGDEEIDDRKHLVMMIMGYGYYSNCWCSSFHINLNNYQIIVKNLNDCLTESFSGLQQQIYISDLRISNRGIEIHLKSAEKISDDDILKKFKETYFGKKISNYFKRIAGSYPDFILMSLDEYEDEDWDVSRTIKYKNMAVDSLTSLLKKHKASVSVIKANKILIKNGLLEEQQRNSQKNKNKIKKFKALTKQGLKYGLNEANQFNDEEVIPKYYINNFENLLAILEIEKDRKKIKLNDNTSLISPDNSSLDKVKPEIGYEKYLDLQEVSYWKRKLNLEKMNKRELNDQFLKMMSNHSDHKYCELPGLKKISPAQAFIDNGADINCVGDETSTPLICGVEMACLPFVKWCIHRGADINKKVWLKSTALMEACGNVQSNCFVWENSEQIVKIAKYLIKMGADPLSRTSNNRSALTIAKKSNNTEMFYYLKTITSKIKEKYYTLKEAIFSDNEELVSQLLAKGKKPNLKIDKKPALVYLTTRFNPNLKIIKSLITAGADVNIEYQDDKDMINNGNSILHFAAQSKNVDLLKIVLEKINDVNKQNNVGMTALHMAVHGQSLDNLKIILKLIEDVNRQNNYGETALHLAVKNDVNTSILKELLHNFHKKNHINVNIKDNKGDTPIFTLFTSEKNYFDDDEKLEHLNILLEAKAKINILNNKDENLLTLALGSPKCEEKIRDIGLDSILPDEVDEGKILQQMGQKVKYINIETFLLIFNRFKKNITKENRGNILMDCINAERFDLVKIITGE